MNELPGDETVDPGNRALGVDLVTDAENLDPLLPVEPEAERSDAWSFLKELPFLIVGALIVAVLVKSFLVQVFWIPSGSMEETLQIGDRVIVNKLAYRIGDPVRGDVVVFEPETSEQESVFTKVSRNLLESIGLRTPESDLIKRIIGLPGDTIEIKDNQIQINGSPLNEPYLRPNIRMNDFGPEVIPVNNYFVMGDNRSSSRDSRVFGPIERSRIVGRAFFVVWPPGRWSGL
ncbi:MAG: signal peptidase I [Actinomycetota bacterium]|nr:signal peptidase I [Actinomycetota bacterium]